MQHREAAQLINCVFIWLLFVCLFVLGSFVALFGYCSFVWPPDQCGNKPEMEASWKWGGDWVFPLHSPPSVHFCHCQFVGGDVNGGCDYVNTREEKEVAMTLKQLKNPPLACVWT